MHSSTSTLLFILLFFHTSLFGSTYEDGNTNDTSRWIAIKGNISTLSNIEDFDNPSNRIIKVHNRSSKYQLNINYTSDTANTKLSWDMLQNTGDYAFYLYLKTDNGERMIYYNNRKARKKALLGNWMRVGIADSVQVGQWSNVSVDFASDLASVEPNNRIISVDRLVIRGVFSIDNIKIENSNITTPPPVVDKEAPVITPNGNRNITLFVGDTYSELGATVTDNVDINLVATISGSVDTTTPDTYTINYSATDTAGNSASITRTILVKPIIVNNFVTTSDRSIYEDGNTNDTSRWIAIKGNMSSISNDIEDDNRVIKVHSRSSKYQLNINYTSDIANTKLSWDMLQNTGDYAFYLYLKTDNGERMIYYNNRKARKKALLGNWMRVGIADSVQVGQWSNVSVDFANDLASVEPNNRIISVDRLVIRGVFSVDNIKIENSNTTTPPPVVDNEAPVITPNGNKNITLFVGDTYSELGATVTDNVDTNLVATISGSVDTTTPDTYTITYSATDTAGNSASSTRTILVKPVITTDGELLAFPKAEGSGANTVGGRGGKVIEVTNLNSSGKGSLREACESNGRRTVVFRVGGTIDLLNKNIIIKNDNITIAGQTAPGDGIQIKNGGLVVNASEVIIRYIRIRPGPTNASEDALTIKSKNRHNREKNIIIDHVSAFWGVDEVLDAGSFSDNITIQWSIIAEGLNQSIHHEGSHSRGIMTTENSRNITIHHNLIYRNYKRNPLIQSSDADVVNNVMVNYQYQVFIQPFKGKVEANFVGNYFRSYRHRRPPIRVYDYDRGYDGESGIYYEDNYDSHFRPNIIDSEYKIRILHQGSNSDGHVQDKTERYPFIEVQTETAQDAYQSVLAQVGANYPVRDTTDSRVIREVESGKAPRNLVNHPNDVGGWPILSNGTPPTDTDHDGIADIWENNHGLNPNNSLDGNDKTLSQEGYTNLEVYINSLIP